MIRELYTEDLDINLKYNIYLHCVQNDDVILNINVYDKSLQADLSNYTCRLKAFKSDHIPLIQNTNIDVTGNVVKIEASKQLTTTAGIVKAELQFTDKSTLKKKSTFFIEIKVEKSALNVDGALSTPMCTLLEEIDNKLDQIENIGQVLDEAKQVRDTLESDIVVGNTTNENIVQSISDADSKKREVEISISNASDKISEVEDSITNADNSRNALDRSKEVANETKIDLDNANVQAEKNIEELNKLGDVTDLAAKVQTNTENISKNNKSIEEVNSHLNEKANLSDVKIFTSLSDIGLTLNDMTTDFGTNILKIIKAMGRNRKIVLYPYQDETNTNLYNSVKTWCGYNTDAYTLIVNSSFNGSENLPNKIEVLPNYNTGNNKMFIGFYDNQLGTAQEVAITKKQQLTLLNGWLPYDVQPYTACCGNLLCVNMRIKSGTYTAGTWIAETGKIPLGGGSNFFQATDVSGSKIGSVALTNTGRIEIVGAFSHNADVSINFTATIN
ncbi:viral A-type inclusion protein [Clostridium butyricum]|uniref:viral A-type inclusion protein n=1 Tax=Clostridium butyricum TaxID=1492 RepID=UPI0028FD7E5F|nr:viral A-type inclusion protein [Clostridium butyricum]MDU0323853.1 viral A-type inclusion protein [Clostridium butyricum]